MLLVAAAMVFLFVAHFGGRMAHEKAAAVAHNLCPDGGLPVDVGDGWLWVSGHPGHPACHEGTSLIMTDAECKVWCGEGEGSCSCNGKEWLQGKHSCDRQCRWHEVTCGSEDGGHRQYPCFPARAGNGCFCDCTCPPLTEAIER
jgi:hypothetical protein